MPERVVRKALADPTAQFLDQRSRRLTRANLINIHSLSLLFA
jgi:hypothetical protein